MSNNPRNNAPGMMTFNLSAGFEEALFGGLRRPAAPPPNPYAPPAQDVPWHAVIGNAEAIESLREAVEYPTKYAELYAAYGQTPSKGALLYGPPGNGKTLLAKALATACGVNDGGFSYLRGDEMASKYFGETEQKIKDLFAFNRAYHARTGRKAILFIDEAEAMLGDRGRYWQAQWTVPTFLNELDGLRESHTFVLLATNRPNELDPAILRDGRIDRRIEVRRPTHDAARTILRNALANRPHDASAIDVTIAYAYSDDLAFYELELPSGARHRVCLRDAVSGAAIVGLANRATATALRRDRGAQIHQCSGVSATDLRDAVWGLFEELRGLDQSALIVDVMNRLGESACVVRKSLYDDAQRLSFAQIHTEQKSTPQRTIN